jgi:putative membrane protein
MKYKLTEQEQQFLNTRVAEAEQRTGAQIVLAVVGRSDSYPELPWKAFALAASAGGFAAVLSDHMRASWHAPETVLVTAAASLIAGATAALLVAAWPGFARLFLDRTRAEAETLQYAESLFLKRELFSTTGRSGILLLVSLFERQVVVLPDAGLAKRLGRDGLASIIRRMTTLLVDGRVSGALDQGLVALEELLAATAPLTPAKNELKDAVVQEDGP